MEPEPTSVFGQPRGVGYLIFVEGWTNFASYGVRVLLLLYLTRELLVPGHAGHVLALTPLRAVFTYSYGVLSVVALRRQSSGRSPASVT